MEILCRDLVKRAEALLGDHLSMDVLEVKLPINFQQYGQKWTDGKAERCVRVPQCVCVSFLSLSLSVPVCVRICVCTSFYIEHGVWYHLCKPHVGLHALMCYALRFAGWPGLSHSPWSNEAGM